MSFPDISHGQVVLLQGSLEAKKEAGPLNSLTADFSSSLEPEERLLEESYVQKHSDIRTEVWFNYFTAEHVNKPDTVLGDARGYFLLS